MSMVSQSVRTGEDRDPQAYENEHVHQVYEQIAPHFSSTRYKVMWSRGLNFKFDSNRVQPWPIVEKFLRDQTPGSVGLDVGCGNGKYLGVNRDVFILASDR